MRLVQFNERWGSTILVNPDLVTSVAASTIDESNSVICTADKRSFAVLETLEDVRRKLTDERE